MKQPWLDVCTTNSLTVLSPVASSPTLLLKSIPSYDEQHPCLEGSGALGLSIEYGSEDRRRGIRRLFSDPLARQAFCWLEDLERSRAKSWTQHADRLRSLSNPSRWRSTSRPQDEAICLAGLLDLTYAERAYLFSLDATQRLKQLILNLDSVPADILFVDLPRSPESGFAWIPVSFLSGSFDASMTGSQIAAITPNGLQLSAPGIILEGQIESIFEDKRVYIQHQDKRYMMAPRHVEGFDWPGSATGLAIVLRKPLTYPGLILGALVAIKTRTEDQLVCHFLYPIFVDGHDEQALLCDAHAVVLSGDNTNMNQVWYIW
jgi:hypothetical protein